jgi:hypothetical protein
MSVLLVLTLSSLCLLLTAETYDIPVYYWDDDDIDKRIINLNGTWNSTLIGTEMNVNGKKISGSGNA